VIFAAGALPPIIPGLLVKQGKRPERLFDGGYIGGGCPFYLKKSQIIQALRMALPYRKGWIKARN
jgi:hypothetical protein